MKQVVSLSIFLVLAIIVLWSITSSYYTESQLPPSKSKKHIEMFMNDFEMTVMDKNGKPDFTLDGTHLQRYNNSDDTEIEQPVIRLLRKDSQWKVSAEKAYLNHKGETVRLVNNVIMQQLNIEPAVTIRTQNLLINAATKIVKTKAHVDISQGKSRIMSEGMVYNNLTSELVLLSNVNGYYLPYD